MIGDGQVSRGEEVVKNNGESQNARGASVFKFTSGFPLQP